MPFNPQLGIAEETTVGTAVTVTRFYDFGNESVKQNIERIEYMGLRPNKKMMGSTNWVPGRVDVTGDIEMPVMSAGMALWFKHCLGAIATTTPTGGTTTRDHKATVGTIDGKSLTIQLGIPVTGGGAAQAFTYSGCKIDKWSLKHDTQSQLMLNVTIDGQAETTATGLASASYASGLVPYAYTKGIISIAGSSFDVTDWSLEGNNNLAKDRYFIRSSTPASKKEQLEAGGLREYTGTINAEFTDTTAYTRFVNGTPATFTAIYTQSTAIEGALFPTITVSIPYMRFDGETPDATGFEIVKQALPFKVLDSADPDGPVVVVVRSNDTTP